MKKPGLLGVLILLTALFSGCDLFSDLTEVDLQKKIDEAVDYANAARLTVLVRYPIEWGQSAQIGQMDSSGTRKGFRFNASFTPSSLYGFAGWKAFRAADYDAWVSGGITAAGLLAKTLTEPDALIETHADNSGTFTINITDPVTLVPWCEEIPRLLPATIPPLQATGAEYPRTQTISLSFSIPMDPASVIFAPGHIEIIGSLTTGASPGPYNGTGDLTEEFFNAPDFSDGNRTVTITVKSPIPAGMDISVIVGQGVRGAGTQGKPMTEEKVISYRTNSTLVWNVFAVPRSDLRAIHDPTKASAEAADTPINADKGFFYDGASLVKDRRLRKADGGRKVYLYFTVANRGDVTGLPSHFRVEELHYATLSGGTGTGSGPSTTYTLSQAVTLPPGETTSGAGAVYGPDHLGVPWYRIEHTLQSTQRGIIRLLVLPYRDSNDNGIYTDPGDVAPNTTVNAIADLLYITVVLDDMAPGGDADLNFDSAKYVSAISGSLGKTTYHYTQNKPVLMFNLDLDAVRDNGVLFETSAWTSSGIAYNSPGNTGSLPWTMDTTDALQWTYRIAGTSTVYYPAGAAISADGNTWFDRNQAAADQTLDLQTLYTAANPAGKTAWNNGIEIQMQYKDSLGNVSAWFGTKQYVSYNVVTLTDVSKWSAVYDETQNTITVTWTKPENMDKVTLSYSVNGGVEQTVAAFTRDEESYPFTGVPGINADGVRNGTPVSNVTGYTITLRSSNTYGTAAAPPMVKIWNIPGMRVSSDNPAIEIFDNGNDSDDSDGKISLKYITVNNAKKIYVLANDISLSGTWTPIGTSSASSFKGKFYGNGHTISGIQLSVVQYTGLFGSVIGAEIRDLTVKYAGTAALSGNITYLGAVAAYADNSKLRNLMVEVPAGCVMGYTSTNTISARYAGGIAGYLTDSTVENCRAVGDGTLNIVVSPSSAQTTMTAAGGIAGYLAGSSSVRNCNSALAVNLSNTTTAGTGNLFGGGIVGRLANPGSILDYAVSNCRSSGAVTVTANTAAAIFAGGAVGQCENPSSIDNLTVSCTVTINKGTYLGYNYCGGIIGYNKDTSIDRCEFSGRIVIPNTFEASDTTHIGGIAGYYTAGTTSPVVSNSSASGDLVIQSQGSGQMNIGGVFGYIEGVNGHPVGVTDCRYEAGDITAARTLGSGIFYVGGFAGSINNYSSFFNCRSLAGSVSAHSNSILNVGGFAGGLRNAAALDGCYAITNVSSTGSDYQITGGLVGATSGGSSISRCYAAGSVQAVSTGGEEEDYFYTGGLVGNASNTNISDSYALGNVLADKTGGGGDVIVGGLVGAHSTINKIITRCFSAGTVTAQSAGSGVLYAGGIIGQKPGNTILANNIALGASVTVKSSGTKNIGRVYGTAVTPGGNYGSQMMALGSASSYYTYTPVYTYPGTGSPAASGVNGTNAADSDLRNSTFWTDRGFNGDDSDPLTIDDTTRWNFSNVYSKRHPALAGLGGQ